MRRGTRWIRMVCWSAGAAADATFSYNKAITLGNGFAALHPSLKFLAPVYNAGDLALVHRVAYPNQSRSHFDSQNYWESAAPNNKLVTDGIFYRTIIQSGLANTSPLTGVSIQSGLPYSLRGSGAAMTNLVDPTRYNLLGVPNNSAANYKADKAIYASDQFPFPAKLDRELLNLQYKNLTDTLGIFAGLIGELGKTFWDDVNTDGDTAPYNLFPTTNAQNGGYALHGNDANKYVVDTGAYNSSGTGFMNNLKAAALVLNKTDAIIAGTEFSGFDTHQTQGGITGTHPNLQRRIGWAMYALRKYFLINADKCTWNNLVVVTLSEFGRTTVQNGSAGTDHAEAGAMFIAGGAVNGYNKGAPHPGVFGCSDTDSYNGQSIPWVPGSKRLHVRRQWQVFETGCGLPFSARQTDPRPPGRDAEPVEPDHPGLYRDWRTPRWGRHFLRRWGPDLWRAANRVRGPSFRRRGLYPVVSGSGIWVDLGSTLAGKPVLVCWGH